MHRYIVNDRNFHRKSIIRKKDCLRLLKYRSGLIYKKVRVVNGRLYIRRDFEKKILYDFGIVDDLPRRKLSYGDG